MKLLFLTFILLTIQLENNTLYSIVKLNDHFQILQGQAQGAIAWGKFIDTIEVNGWGKISLQSPEYDFISAFALGYLEGALTVKRIQNQYYNSIIGYEHISENYKSFLMDQYQWTMENIQQNVDDPYWIEVGKFMQYFQGMVDGFNKYNEQGKTLNLYDFLFLQAVAGDNTELDQKFKNSAYSMKNKTKLQKNIQRGHCSAILKQVGSEVYLGHTTFGGYNIMQRVYKFFKFGNEIDIQFSGYFGTLYSNDDFYVLNKQKLLVIETSNNVLDESLFDLIQYKSLLTWQRTMIANFMAQNGKQWTQIFIKYNSGTYNNQYMIVDSSKFNYQTSTPQADFLWVIEQMPGLYENADMTQTLINQGYWPSYNVPFFKKIYKYSGFEAAYEDEGNEYSYEKCPRAKIFKRDHHKVKDMDSYKALMRQNNFQNDPLSLGDANNQIAARGDLNENGSLWIGGAIDCKVISLSNLQNGQKTEIQSGPTFYQQPIFTWNKFKDYKARKGQPDTFDFDWVTLESDF